jgi:hypothetical protein
VAKSSGGINACARVHSRALFQPGKRIFVNTPTYQNPKPGAGGGGNADPDEAAGKTHKRGPERTAWGGMCNWDRRGRVRASEITLSGAGRCIGRGHARRGTRNGGNARAWRCRNRDRRGRVCASEITLSGADSCSGRGRVRGGARTATRMRTQPVPSDSAPFRLLNENSTCNFRGGIDRTVSRRVSHLFLKEHVQRV